MNNRYAHRDSRNDADDDERYGRKQGNKTFSMLNGTSHSFPKNGGRPPKSRIETEENEDLEVDEGKVETGSYPDPTRFPEP